MRNAGDFLDIKHIESGIAQRLPENQAGVGADGFAKGIHFAWIHKRGVDAKARQRVFEQIVRAAVKRAGGDDMRPGTHQCGNRQMHRRLAAGSGYRTNAPFERGDAFFENGVGRVGNARIDVARALHVKQRCRLFGVLEDIRGGEVNRLRAGAELRVRLLAGVQTQGVELVGLGYGHDHEPNKKPRVRQPAIRTRPCHRARPRSSRKGSRSGRSGPE